MELRSILATDCGSTTTKAILIQKIEGEYRLTHRGEAPTTVEAPFEDVTRGVLNAVMEIEELVPSSKPERGYVLVKVTTKADGEVIVTQNWRMLIPTKSHLKK